MTPAEPACWSWPVRPVKDLAAASLGSILSGLSAAARELILEGRDEGLLALGEWQQGRCAICGQGGRLVLDHDHVSALVRGYLCRSCNVREARTFGVFELYRQRNPAVILGVSSVYESIFGAAQPTPALEEVDRWRKNPAAGIGL